MTVLVTKMGNHRESNLGAGVGTMNSVLDRSSLRYLCNVPTEMSSMQLYI